MASLEGNNSPAITVNLKAPVIARGEIYIHADLETVWSIMVTVEQWPDWNPDIKSVEVDGPIQKGTQMRWKSGPGMITSLIQHVEAPRVLAWSGNTMGIQAVHVWRMEETSQGTHVETEESWEGVVVSLLRGQMKKMLQAAIDSGLGYLKKEAERRLL